MAVNPETLKIVQRNKANIIALQIFPLLEEDDTSAEVQEMAEQLSTDIEVVDQVIALIENMILVDVEIFDDEDEPQEKWDTIGDDDFSHSFIGEVD